MNAVRLFEKGEIEEMATLKMVFVVLLCIPMMYISLFLLGKLIDEFSKKSDQK